MEGQVWTVIERLLLCVEGQPRRCHSSDREILRVILWAVLFDRPIVWACQPEHWWEGLCPQSIPDPSTVSRRWRLATISSEPSAKPARLRLASRVYRPGREEDAAYSAGCGERISFARHGCLQRSERLDAILLLAFATGTGHEVRTGRGDRQTSRIDGQRQFLVPDRFDDSRQHGLQLLVRQAIASEIIERRMMTDRLDT